MIAVAPARLPWFAVSMRSLLHHAEARPRVTFVTSVLLALALGVIDVVTAPELSFQLFYLGVVALTAWCNGSRPGIVMAAICALSWQAGDVLSGREYTLAITPYWNLAVRFASFGFIANLIARLRLGFERQRAMAHTDPLTGLHNPRAFHLLAEQELEGARRAGRPIALAFIDLDNFKTVNDTMGHLAGDTALQTAAHAIRDTLRGTDIVARLGGDEFAVLMPGANAGHALRALGNVGTELRDAMRGGGWPVTASIGAVICPHPPAALADILPLADAAMYSAKRAGKDTVHVEILEPARSAA